MNDEQKAAYIIAQAAVLQATVAGMAAENMIRWHRSESMAYDESAFEDAINKSGVHHNAVIEFFHS